MTDRHAGYLVMLKQDISEDDAEHTIHALRMIKGVLSVEPIVADADLMIAEARAVSEWRSKISRLLWPERNRDAD